MKNGPDYSTRTTLWTVASGRGDSLERAQALVGRTSMVLTLSELRERAAYARRNGGAILGCS